MGSRRIEKYTHLFLMLIPFAVPPLMGLLEEVCGRIMWLNYAMLTVFIVSLITLYVWGITSAVTYKKQGPLWYELFLFHVVRIPLFVMAWFIYMVAFVIIIFCVNGFDGIQ